MTEHIVYERKKQAAFFDDLKFLADAVCKDTTRAYMMVIHAEEADGMMILVSTDGRRLHKISYPVGEAPIKEAGDYTVVSKKADIIILEKTANPDKFPDWRRVMPENTIRLYDCLTFSKKDFDQDYYKVCQIGILVNTDFLRPLGNTIKPLTWTLDKAKTDNGSPAALVFTAQEREAVIMPIGIDNGTACAVARAKQRLEEAAAAPAPEPQPPVSEAEPETEPEAQATPEAAEPQPPAPEPVKYWIGFCAGRHNLAYGAESRFKKEASTSKAVYEISAEVYQKARSAGFLYYALDSFEVYQIQVWQQAETALKTGADTKEKTASEKAAADKPMAPPKKPASRKTPKADTGKWQSAGIGKQIYRCNF